MVVILIREGLGKAQLFVSRYFSLRSYVCIHGSYFVIKLN